MIEIVVLTKWRISSVAEGSNVRIGKLGQNGREASVDQANLAKAKDHCTLPFERLARLDVSDHPLVDGIVESSDALGNRVYGYRVIHFLAFRWAGATLSSRFRQ
jgi:hypothetical protein